MSRLSKLMGKPKEFEIGGEIFTFQPLTVEDLDLIMDLESENKRAIAMKKIIRKTLKKAVSDATDEEIEKVAMEHFDALTKAIMDVNNLSGERKVQTQETTPTFG